MDCQIKEIANKIYNQYEKEEIKLVTQFKNCIQDINNPYSMMTSKPERGEANKNTGTKYSEFNQIKNINGIPIDPPNINETMIEFLNRAGFKSFEGSSKDETLLHYQQLIKNNQCKKIIEIGFNIGHSTQFLLDASEDVEMISLDIMLHPYCAYAKMYIDMKYPGRHILLSGSSDNTLISFKKMNPSYKADLIFIDGSHTLSGAYHDIELSKSFAHENTILIIDNVVPHAGVGVEVYDALLQHIHQANIMINEHHRVAGNFEVYKDGYAIGKYLFDTYTPVFLTKEQKDEIEHFVPVYVLTLIIDQLTKLYISTKDKKYLLNSCIIDEIKKMIQDDLQAEPKDRKFDTYFEHTIKKHEEQKMNTSNHKNSHYHNSTRGSLYKNANRNTSNTNRRGSSSPMKTSNENVRYFSPYDKKIFYNGKNMQ